MNCGIIVCEKMAKKKIVVDGAKLATSIGYLDNARSFLSRQDRQRKNITTVIKNLKRRESLLRIN